LRSGSIYQRLGECEQVRFLPFAQTYLIQVTGGEVVVDLAPR
jgi:hypothetical protein